MGYLGEEHSRPREQPVQSPEGACWACLRNHEEAGVAEADLEGVGSRSGVGRDGWGQGEHWREMTSEIGPVGHCKYSGLYSRLEKEVIGEFLS